MIVKQTKSGLEIITQTGHAFLAAQIAAALQDKYHSTYGLEVLLATFNHEAINTDFNSGRVLSDIGVPLDFTESQETTEETIEKIKSMTQKALYKSRMIFAFMAQHMLTIHADKESRTFLEFADTLRKKINSHLKEVGLKKKEFVEIYQVLKFSDRLSLMLCQNELPTAGRTFEINTAMEGKTFSVIDNNGNSNVDPWPFQNSEVPLYYEYRLLDQLQFKNKTAFLDCFQQTAIQKKNFTIVKG
ncbi:MAG: DUF3891 family protein [Leeuwenhoekiella sp.]